MSYDLHLIPKSEGDPAEAYERLDERSRLRTRNGTSADSSPTSKPSTRTWT
jgi:hypothetical protein